MTWHDTDIPSYNPTCRRVDFDALAMRQINGVVREVPDGTPIAAWGPDYMAPRLETDTSRAFRGAYEAFDWLKANVDDFPKIRDGP